MEKYAAMPSTGDSANSQPSPIGVNLTAENDCTWVCGLANRWHSLATDRRSRRQRLLLRERGDVWLAAVFGVVW